MAALITRQLGDTWIRTTRRWTMVAWGILGTGILLGGNWAYHALGWGGFWAWDPVENASLMPWLIGTAFLHSVMVQEKKGMLKVWNIVLVIMAYIMSIFGTFLTRSGVVNSVHAFAKSPIGGYFLAFIVIALSGSFYLLIDRLPYLKSENQMGSMVSRESSFLFNNLILLVSCFAVLFGTMFPSLSEWVTGDKITVSAVLQCGERSDRDLSAVPDRRRSAAGMAKGVDQQPEAEFPDSRGRRLRDRSRVAC